MKGRRELDVTGTELACELEPVFDGTVRVDVPLLARCQLLERGGENPHLHELRFESRRLDLKRRLASHTRVHAPPSAALSRIASTMRLARKPSSKVATTGGRAGYGGPSAMHR